MFHIIVQLKLKDIVNTDYVRNCLQEVAAVTLAEEPCCRKLDVFESETDPSIFILFEEWDRREDWIEHREKRAFKEIYAPKVLPLVDRVPHILRRVNL
jgi:quinol monooxygenase YgiN